MSDAPFDSDWAVDALIVTAIPLEFDAVLEVNEGAEPGSKWEIGRSPSGLERTARRNFVGKDDRALRVAVVQSTLMGGVAAVMAVMPAFERWQPRCIAMCGVCAGRRGKVERGDVIFADRLWQYDYGKTVSERDEQGKLVQRFRGDTWQYQIDPRWRVELQSFRAPQGDWLQGKPVPQDLLDEWIEDALFDGRDPKTDPAIQAACPDTDHPDRFTTSIDALERRRVVHFDAATLRYLLTDEGRISVAKRKAKTRKPSTPKEGITVHVGPIATGNQVVEDPTIFEQLSTSMRGVLGLEMEAAAIGAVVEPWKRNGVQLLVAKGVMDHADGTKDDSFKHFAARASAECVLAFLRRHLDAPVRVGVDDVLSDGTADVPTNPERRSLPSTMLNAKHGVVAFEGREELLRDLDVFAASDALADVRLIHASGGMGKTRLAIEWCARLRRDGWRAGFLREGVSDDWLSRLLSGAQRVAVVIDYAEGREDRRRVLDRVRAFAEAAKKSGDDPRRVRVLLLARHAGEWWESLKRETALQSLLDAASPIALTALSETREVVFRRAASAFAAWLGRAEPGAVPDLSQEYFERVLFVHAAALQAVLGGATQPDEDPIDGVLAHERAHWRLRGASVESNESRAHEARVSEIVCAATLTGGYDSRDECARRTAGLGDATARIHASDLYSSSGPDRPRVIGALEPDELGERHVRNVLRTKSQEAVYWLAKALGPEEDRVDAIERAFWVIGRTSGVSENERQQWSTSVFRVNAVARTTPALRVAVALSNAGKDTVLAGIVQDEIAQGAERERVALEVVNSAPPYSVALLELSVLAANAARTGTTEADEAIDAGNRAIRLSNAGRRDEALASIDEATAAFRGLAAQNPEAFLPGLATTINNRATMLSELGRREDALACIEEATASYRTLAARNPDAFLPSLAASINNRANVLSELGRREAALACIEEATVLYRTLAARTPDAFLPDFAASLNNRANMLSNLGRREDALACIDEAVSVQRGLAARNPDAFLPDLAMSLNNRANMLSELGHGEEALACIDEAVSVRRGLADRNPDAVLPSLAMSLNNRATMLSALGRREDALACIEEATASYRTLAARTPDAFLPDLAMSLSNSATMLDALGRTDDAVASIEEALSLLRTLVCKHGLPIRPQLARSLATAAMISPTPLASLIEALDVLWPVVELGHELPLARSIAEHLVNAAPTLSEIPAETRARIERLGALAASPYSRTPSRVR
jgi:nucleoside phosphorylase/tetratricopeptide (TPR) repeat protein